MKYPDKFKFTQQEQVELIKKNYLRLIHIQSQFEGIACTLPQTKEVILYGEARGSNLRLDEVNTIIGLNRAWKYIIEGITDSSLGLYDEVGYRFVSYFHFVSMSLLVSPESAGRTRTEPVTISGTEWVPPYTHVYEYDGNLLNLAYRPFDSITDFALEVFCLIARTQAFIDGNKRTGILVANAILSTNGLGYLEAPLTEVFRDKLLRFYETGDNSDLKSYLYRYYLKGE